MAEVIFQGPAQKRENPFGQIARGVSGFIQSGRKKQGASDLALGLRNAFEGGKANFGAFLQQPGVLNAVQTNPELFSQMFEMLGKLKETDLSQQRIDVTEQGQRDTLSQGQQRIDNQVDQFDNTIKLKEKQLKVDEDQLAATVAANQGKLSAEQKKTSGNLKLRRDKLNADIAQNREQNKFKEREVRVKEGEAKKGARVATPEEIVGLEAQTGAKFQAGTVIQKLKDGRFKIDLPKTGGKATIIDKDGNIQIIEGSESFFTTARIKGDAQQRITQTKNLLGQLKNARDILDKDGGVVGFRGVFSAFKNIVAGQLDQRFIDQNRAEFSGIIESSRLSAQRAISGENRFSENDRKFIFNLFPNLGVFEAPELAKIRLDILDQMFLRRLGSDAKALGVDPQLTPVLSKESVAQKFSNIIARGLMSREEAIETMGILFKDVEDFSIVQK